MPFQLTIAEGKEAGREFTFEQPQVVIGRTEECDVVLYDPGVSRRHARIFAEGTAYFVEDMGSSNGTKVNGSVVKKQQLSHGDAVALGPVVFSFNLKLGDGTDPRVPIAAPLDMADDQGTRIVAAPKPVKRAALAPPDASSDELNKMQRHTTRSLDSLPRKISKDPAVSAGRMAPALAVSRSRGGLTAAERARIRREQPGLGGTLRLFWLEAPPFVRGALLSLGALSLLGIAGGAFWYVAGETETRKVVVEPVMLTRSPIEASFGLGDGVTFQRADMKVFDFDYVSATRAVVILHFQCKDISEGEVTVSMNGADVGKLPADGINPGEVSHEILITPDKLKKGQKNRVIFDNVLNPPGSETWRIWNVWIEIVPLPEESPEELVRDATSAYQSAQLKLERRDIGASNRYEAWKGFRNAWLMLEAHPAPKPELYLLARTKVREAQQELDAQCSKLMLEAAGHASRKDWDSARGTLEHVRDFFPANDQPCPWRAEQKRQELQL